MIWPVLLNPVTRWIGAAVVVVSIVCAAYAYGVQQERQRAAQAALEAYQKTRERLDDAPQIDFDDDAARVRELCRLAGITDCPV